MASGTIKARRWVHIGTQTNTNVQSIPTDCDEIMVVTKHGGNEWTCSMTIPKAYLTDSRKYLMMGSAAMYVGIYATSTTMVASSCRYDGTAASSWITDYYVR